VQVGVRVRSGEAFLQTVHFGEADRVDGRHPHRSAALQRIDGALHQLLQTHHVAREPGVDPAGFGELKRAFAAVEEDCAQPALHFLHMLGGGGLADAAHFSALTHAARSGYLLEKLRVPEPHGIILNKSV